MTPRCRQEFPMLAPWHQRDSYGGGTSVCPRDSWPCSSRVTSCLTPGELSCSLRYWAMRRMILGGFVARRQFEPRPAQGTTSRATPHRPNRDDWCGCTRPCPLFTMWSIGPIAPMCIVRVQRCVSGTCSREHDGASATSQAKSRADPTRRAPSPSTSTSLSVTTRWNYGIS